MHIERGSTVTFMLVFFAVPDSDDPLKCHKIVSELLSPTD